MDPIPGGLPPAKTPEERTLAEAAKACGVETEYWDVWGKEHYASAKVERAILKSLGVDGHGGPSLDRAMKERVERDWLRPLPLTVVLVAGQVHEVPLSLEAWRAGLQAVVEIRFEQGDSRTIPVALGDLPFSEHIVLRGESFVRKKIPLPGDLPLGYHEMSIQIPGLDCKPARLIICPSRAYQPPWLETGRAAGIAISLYGVRSHRNWGCGDTTDLKTVADWVAEEARASFIGLNPLHSIPNRQPYNTSPYLPNSIFYRNPLYLDIEQMEDFQLSPRAKVSIQTAAVRREIQALRSSEFVEYERVYRLKQRFLKLLFRNFLKEWTSDTLRARELAEYIQREGDLLHRFAVHAALDEAIHKEHPDIWHWRAWPEPYQDPESAATRQFAEKNWRQVLFHKYVQWQLDLQFRAAQEHARQRGLSIGLY
ncbi:MAG TPA: 4-alpha-glucanotransferase, partial [Bryobacteraceae bacterium]|nr:4-alpha-glucanotransferase [Bryobacteraceae bacterium]